MGHNTNSANPDEKPHNVASGQGLHFLVNVIFSNISPFSLFE